jgi:predicted ArsR family transcriptional regulator
MNQKLIAEIGKSQRLELINRLKRTQGLSVGELAEQLGMSYMGVKQHCVDLEADGYLDTWRRAKGIGRPELVYRLTDRAHDLFPTASNGMTIALLENAKALYGPAAPEKLLFSVFQKKAEAYQSRVRGETIGERAGKLTRIRDAEGCMAEIEQDAAFIRIVEHHCPILDLLKAFPIVARLEAELFTRVLGAAVQREEAHASGLYRCVFTLRGRENSKFEIRNSK